MSDSLQSRLIRAAELNNPTHGICIVTQKGEEHWDWRSIEKRSRQFAYSLNEIGLKNGDRAAIILPTSIEFMDTFFGCQQLGVVAVPLYPPLRLGKLDEYFKRTLTMLEAANVSVLVTNARIAKILGKIIRQASLPYGLLIAEQLMSEQLSEHYLIDEDALAMAQFSSGTTNAPKPVGLTHRQVLANTDAILDHIDGDVGCSWLPLYHDMGLIGCIFPALSLPGKLVLIPPELFLARPALWLQSISKHRAIVSPAPNFAYSYCAERIKDRELEGVDLSSWLLALNGAEAVAPDHLRKFNNRFAKYGLAPEAMTPVYGLAEAALAVTFSDPLTVFSTVEFDRSSMQKGIAIKGSGLELSTVGKPLRGFSVEIRDKEGSILSEATIGEIHIKGPSIMNGYLNGIPSGIDNGWLRSGDLGFLFNGELYISGRVKDVIILNGQNHAPQDIEQSVDAIDGVRKGCSVAVAEVNSDGEHIYLFVEVTNPDSDFVEVCSSTVLSATGLKLDHIIPLKAGTIPRTSSGKLRRQVTLQRFLSGELLPPKKVNSLYLAGVLAQSSWNYFRSKWD